MDREKKSAAEPLADLAADYGPAVLLLLQPEPEAVAGLLFCGDRVQWRRIGRLTAALGIALGGNAPPEMFEALASSPQEAHRQYQRYVAHQRLAHASGTFGETL